MPKSESVNLKNNNELIFIKIYQGTIVNLTPRKEQSPKLITRENKTIRTAVNPNPNFDLTSSTRPRTRDIYKNTIT